VTGLASALPRLDAVSAACSDEVAGSSQSQPITPPSAGAVLAIAGSRLPVTWNMVAWLAAFIFPPFRGTLPEWLVLAHRTPAWQTMPPLVIMVTWKGQVGDDPRASPCEPPLLRPQIGS
jgi:hypothetical protein